jgi:hypothetical protein
MRQPFRVGFSPLASSSTPALAICSLQSAIAVSISSDGMTPASESLVALTRIMNRIAVSPVSEPGVRRILALPVTANGCRRNRHAERIL